MLADCVKAEPEPEADAEAEQGGRITLRGIGVENKRSIIHAMRSGLMMISVCAKSRCCTKTMKCWMNSQDLGVFGIRVQDKGRDKDSPKDGIL